MHIMHMLRMVAAERLFSSRDHRVKLCQAPCPQRWGSQFGRPWPERSSGLMRSTWLLLWVSLAEGRAKGPSGAVVHVEGDSYSRKFGSLYADWSEEVQVGS